MTFDKSAFEGMINLYREWNGKINVISRKDIDNIFEHHILHSLAIAEYLDRQGISTDGLRILDVGTGGGFPGVPLASVMPLARFTLCDSIGKKILVARSVCSSLGLENVECVNDRAENLKGPFDIVVSRAVTSLENFYPWVKGRYNDRILYLKGGDVDSEIEVLCRKYGIPRSKTSVWNINEYLKDEYFAEKFVIDIRK